MSNLPQTCQKFGISRTLAPQHQHPLWDRWKRQSIEFNNLRFWRWGRRSPKRETLRGPPRPCETFLLLLALDNFLPRMYQIETLRWRMLRSRPIRDPTHAPTLVVEHCQECRSSTQEEQANLKIDSFVCDYENNNGYRMRMKVKIVQKWRILPNLFNAFKLIADPGLNWFARVKWVMWVSILNARDKV